MRVLLTRAAEDATRTRAALEARGHRVFVSPVIAIETRDQPWPDGVVDGILATSGHAFGGLAARNGPNPEARRLMPMWLVGARTEAAARDCGYAGAAVVAPNAVALAVLLKRHRPRRRFVYLAGRDRKPDLETALRVTEQTVDIMEVYEARPAPSFEPATLTEMERGAIDAVLHFSRRSAELFAGLATKTQLPSIPRHFCLSTDVADALKALGYLTTIAARADEASLLAAIDPT